LLIIYIDPYILTFSVRISAFASFYPEYKMKPFSNISIVTDGRL
jgi:hypothetical protein